MRQKSILLISFLGVVGSAGLVSGCGGGGSPSVSASGSGSGSGSASASGTITDFGSIYVTGKEYEIDDSTSTSADGAAPVKGDAAAKGVLKRGMTVIVSGLFSGHQHFASSITQKDAVEGLVQSVAADGLSLVVMGQTVLVDETSIIDNNIPGQNILNLAPGAAHVEVNGHIQPNGVIRATFIENKLTGVTPEVRGYVSNHLAGTSTFQIGNLTVNYAGAVINDMPNPAGNAWNGLFVEVKGGPFTPGPNAQTEGTLTATKVEPENRGVADKVDEFEVEGIVTQVLGLGDFFVGTTHVQTTSTTEFRGGTIDEIVVGARLSAEGRFANGILTAKHVRFHENVRLEGDIEAVGANSLTIKGLPGVIVTVNSQTEFKATGGATANSFSDLAVDDHVRVRGRVNGTNSVIATRIQLRSPDDDVDLQGPVQAVADPNLTILGVTVDTAGIAEDEFEGLDDGVIGRAAFFSAVQVGTLVKVQGRLNGGVVTWREAELEDGE